MYWVFLCLSSGTDLQKSRHVLKSLILCNKVLSYLITVLGYLFPRHLLCCQQWHRTVSHRWDHRRENGEHTGQSSTDGCRSWPGSLCQHCQVRIVLPSDTQLSSLRRDMQIQNWTIYCWVTCGLITDRWARLTLCYPLMQDSAIYWQVS